MTFEGYRAGDAGLRRVSIALFAGSFSSFGLLYYPQPLLPEFSRTFGVPPSTAALSISVTTIALGLALLFAGQVSEIVGRTRMMRWSLVLAAVVAGLTAFVTSWPWMLALRAITGLMLAGFPAVAMAYLREEVHPSSHARATGLYIGGTALGGMAGRLVSGGLTQVADWRWAMGGTAAYALICAAVVLLVLPESRNFQAAPRGVRASAAAFLGVLRDPTLVGLYLVGGISMGSYVALFNITGYRLEAAPYLLPVGLAGLVYLVNPLGAASSTMAGRYAERFGRRAVVPIGFLITMAGVGLTLLRPLWVFVAGLAVVTVGFFVVHGVASGWTAARAYLGGRSTGSAASMYLFGYYLGSSVLGTLAGTAWRHGGWTLLAEGVLVMLVLGLGISLLLRRTPVLSTPPGPTAG
ncbi:MFS transporter [Blastococcus sp. Marseille-P5729]|uniref:MFS transporter n=1 Tax=Blastococcus sp. Marseille-P5729 TaxID=2086582 RepID=UPI0018FE06B1|nr:MFS transporter [Blastococcus sp. Marseille-P5729]